MKVQAIAWLLLLSLTYFISANEVNTNITVLSLNESVCNRNLCLISKDGEYRFCNCEKDCFKTGDCCLGLYSEEEEENVREQDIHELYQHPDIYSGRAFKLVGRCPRNATNETEIQQCHNSVQNASNPIMMFPMTSVITNITYKNLACGRCNEGTHTQFQLQFECPEINKLPETIEEGFHLYLSNRSCVPTIPQNSVIIDYWFSEANDTVVQCPSFSPNDSIDNWRCHAYFAPFTYNGSHYKNIFCAKCNGIQVTQEDAVCRESLYTISDTFTFQIDANYSIGGESPFSGKRCTAGSVYDPNQQKCRVLFSSSSVSFEEESTVITTDHSEIISNTVNRIKIPKCNLQLYNKTDYEQRQSTINPGFNEIFIKATNNVYQEGEFKILLLDDRVEVCAKQKGFSLPPCINNHCKKNSDPFPLCSCKADCFKTKSCCIDALTDEEINSARRNDLSTCTPLSSGSFIWAVSNCPKNYDNKFVRQKCETLNSTDPFLEVAVYSNLTDIAYKNIYCGICHNAKELLFVPFEIVCDARWNFRTPETALKWTKGDNDVCYLSYMINSTLYCSTGPGYQCPRDWELSSDLIKQKVNWMCQKIRAPINVKQGNSTENFRNVYCAQCNGINLDSQDMVVRCFTITAGLGAGGSAKVPRPSSLAVLFQTGK